MNDAPESAHHIVECARYIRDHPAPSTPQGRQAKTDREIALDRWIAKAQLIAAK